MKTYKVSELADVVGGATPSTSIEKYWDGDIFWITPKDLSIQKSRWISRGERKITREGLESCSTSLLPQNTVLFSSRAPIGYVSIALNTLCTNQGFKSLVAKKDKVHYMYLYYLLKHKAEELENLGSGTTFKEVSGSVLRNHSVTIHERIEEQKAIADVLASLDDKIELNNKINKNLEEQAQALFKRWFVDFEFPNKDGNPYKSSGGEMVDSELGEIPEGWEVKSLDEIADFLNGLAMQKFRPKEDSIAYKVIKIRELNNDGFTQDSEFCDINISKQYVVENGDVIFSWSGTLLVKLWTGGIGGLNQHLFKVTSTKYKKWFYYLWLLYHLEEFKAIAGDKATTMGHIKREHLTKAKIMLPSDLKTLDEIMEPMLDRIIVNKIENQKLAELRDYLLPKLMSGEIRVKQ